MPPNSVLIDITGYPLIPLEKAADGLYVYPRIRYGILPYYINPIGQIVWGCIESNRVEPITLAPAAGTQDIIAVKDEQHLVLESGKPLPDLGPEFDFLNTFKGQLFRDQVYQDIIECLIRNGFNDYLENPLATDTHEAYEEHGIDLRNIIGHDKHLQKTVEKPDITISAPQPNFVTTSKEPQTVSSNSNAFFNQTKFDTQASLVVGPSELQLAEQVSQPNVELPEAVHGRNCSSSSSMTI